MHAARPDVDDEQHEATDQAEGRENLDGEEVSAGDGAEVRLQEGAPRSVLAAFGRGFEAVRKQRVLDRVACDVVAEVVKRPANSRGSPGRGM